ncbi:hypothetical protein [Chryseosolibacter indicus]|uniref:DUF7847 domain-containing protein n=1 Tax=Chryseosolibacter indicus TaxID=2782351 RepID=A0ABS5VWM6_9BACT|nr:hypothetical protein [Chryseosolibacter indicus]MBT1704401.1 hypothetical protein [Chryseosolibacter indicus]
MEKFNVINFHKTRDFSNKMNATFEFIKQNFKPLSKSILVIAGPPILIASLLMGSFIGDMFSMTALATQGGNQFETYFTSPSLWLQILLIVVFFLVSGVGTIATINNYIVLYGEKRTNQIEVHEIWQRVRETFWMYLGTMLLFALLAVAVYILMIIPVVLLAAISPFLIGFGIIALICGVIYFFVACSFVFIIRTYERVGFFESIKRSFILIRGKWWSTFGLVFILYIIVGTVSYIFLIPWYAMTIAQSLHSVSTSSFQEPGTTYQIVTMVFFTLYYLAQMVMYAMPNVGIAFQYFNLVERKEARGLMSQIESFGEAPTPPASNNNIEETY